jgi:hypothetical protein
MWYQLIRMVAQKMRMVEEMRRKTFARLRNFWYFVERALQVPRDIILALATIGIFRLVDSLKRNNSLFVPDDVYAGHFVESVLAINTGNTAGLLVGVLLLWNTRSSNRGYF